MKSALTICSLVLGIGFTQVACGLSPLLHHSNPVRNEINHGNQNDLVMPVPVPGCVFYFKTQNLCAKLDWVAEQSDEGYGQFTLSFWDKNEGTSDGPFLNPTVQSVFVKLFMPSMGHGSSPVKVAQLTDADGNMLVGQFDATQVYFSMPGRWQIIVQLKNGKDVIDQAAIDYQAN